MLDIFIAWISENIVGVVLFVIVIGFMVTYYSMNEKIDNQEYEISRINKKINEVDLYSMRREAELWNWLTDNQNLYMSGKAYRGHSLISFLLKSGFENNEIINDNYYYDDSGIRLLDRSFTASKWVSISSNECSYCGREFGEKDRCQHCGAPAIRENIDYDIWR